MIGKNQKEEQPVTDRATTPKEEYRKGNEATADQFETLAEQSTVGLDGEKQPELKQPDHSPDNRPRTQEQAEKEAEEKDRLVYRKNDKKKK
jgi:hypothetical protein